MGGVQVVNYAVDNDARFVVRDFQKSKTFSSFLPGIAGLHGIPLWAFYVNRGQGIASFGIQDKDGAIMEFQPAHKAYQLTPTQGFRTFLKIPSDGFVWEPFGSPGTENDTMMVSANKLTVETAHPELGLVVRVNYFILPNEPFAALVRRVTIQNKSTWARDLEIVDGLAQLLPFGLDNMGYKAMGYTLKSWMDVENLDHDIPFYRLRASTADVEEVSGIEAGHFHLSFIHQGGLCQRAKPIVDAELIFSDDTTLKEPLGFFGSSLAELLTQSQVTTNKVPSAFATASLRLEQGETVDVVSMIGHTGDISFINQSAEALTSLDFIVEKEREAEAIARELASRVKTHTSQPIFDAYCAQSYLDNALRGGIPMVMASNPPGKKFVYHVYSRKHGDPERDYNAFSIAPTYYSQGDGNYRDVNQNRRLDVLFNPEVGTWDIETFVNLIQTDGYNPLVVKGSVFIVTDSSRLEDLVDEESRQRVQEFFRNPFTPGSLLMFLESPTVRPRVSPADYLAKALELAEQTIMADYGEGYWIDHFTYVLDLVQNYLAVYPDKLLELLLGERKYRFYDSPAFVRPRDEKCVLVQGVVCQRRAIAESSEKCAALAARGSDKHWVRTRHGNGEIYTTNLYSKLLALATLKFATLDPDGVGVEMEANKPGWNDSMNGLPGLFGSGFGELCEVTRLVEWLLGCHDALVGSSISLPTELHNLFVGVHRQLEDFDESVANASFVYWDAVSTLRERYRGETALGFAGAEVSMPIAEVEQVLRAMQVKLREGIKRAGQEGEVYPTYFYYEAIRWEAIVGEDGRHKVNQDGYPLVRPTAFRRIRMPLFLEGPARAMKVLGDRAKASKLHVNVKQSALFDTKLKMFKSSESLLSQPMSIGRGRAFTPGWLENESIFMHVEYKYLLELLRSGLYAEFFEHMQSALVPFLDARVYGRSPLEHSSFIASSANPDSSVHGRGFIARLSGSTAEFLHMWTIIMFGGNPFVLRDGSLVLQLAPVLPAWLFDGSGRVSFRFLGSCDVTYVNEGRRDTYTDEGAYVARYEIQWKDGTMAVVQGNIVPEPHASRVRAGEAASMLVSLCGATGGR